MSTIYTDGYYVREHPTWHVEDSPWKAQQVLKILGRNSIAPKRIAEVGCGAGEALRRMGEAFPDAACQGFEISPQAFAMTRGRERANVSYHLCDVRETTDFFDLILLLDVIEHVEDCFGFLRSLRPRTQYLVAHIPLDLSVFSLLIDTPLANRRSAGHIHYFTKSTALALLSDTGYKVLDCFHPRGGNWLPNRGWRSRLMSPFRAAASLVAPESSAILLGGSSLVILAR